MLLMYMPIDCNEIWGEKSIFILLVLAKGKCNYTHNRMISKPMSSDK